MAGPIKIKIKTLTPLWTGDVNGKCTKLKETGIIGSLRWWYEALVRGLGGYACDPTSDERCKLDQKKFQKTVKELVKKGGTVEEATQKALDEQICPVCQLFGCTGWKKKLKFEITEINGRFSDGFMGKFILKLLEIKKLREEEKWLLEKTLNIISEYGSIGGKTTRKPQKHPIAGKDYGLIEIIQNIKSSIKRESIENWLKLNKTKLKDKQNKEWPNFRYFFFIKGVYLNRIQINTLMNKFDYLKGFPRNGKGKGKRIFSFKSGGGRIWGYVKDNSMLKEVTNYISAEFKISNIKKFEDVIK